MEKKTVSFSAALHEMLTLGARIRLADWPAEDYLEVREGALWCHTAEEEFKPDALEAYEILSTNWEIIGSDIGKTTFTPAQ